MALDLLYQVTRIDCAIYCTFGIGDYVLGVVCSQFRTEFASTTAVQLWTSELVSVSRCDTLNYMGPRARGRKIDLEYLEQRVLGHVNLVEDLGKRSKSLDQLLRG